MEMHLNDAGVVLTNDQAAFCCKSDGSNEAYFPVVPEGQQASQPVMIFLSVVAMLEDPTFLERIVNALNEDHGPLRRDPGVEHKLNNGDVRFSEKQSLLVIHSGGRHEVHVPDGAQNSEAAKLLVSFATVLEGPDYIKDVLNQLSSD